MLGALPWVLGALLADQVLGFAWVLGFAFSGGMIVC
jgi:hypothetical protein